MPPHIDLIFGKMRTLLLWPALAGAQVLSIGRTISPDGKLLGIDSIFRFEKSPAVLPIQYRVPSGYERDTFLLLVRNATGPLAWIALPPPKNPGSLRQARLQLARSGVYGLFIYTRGTGNRIWAFRRIYIILPPYQTLTQVKAQHNILLAQRSRQAPPSTPLQDTAPIPEPPDDPLQNNIPLSEPVDITLPTDEVTNFDDIILSPLEENPSSNPEDEEMLDEP